MFLKCNRRKKDGKVHRYWSIVESYRLANGRSAKRQVLYLGEINDSQKSAWCKSIAALEGWAKAPQQIALFPTDRQPPEELTHAASEVQPVQVDLSRLELCRPRQWGACWLALQVWNLLGLDEFFKPKLPPSRKGTSWYKILQLLVCARLIKPSSEWYVHREWYRQSAMGDLLGMDADIVPKNALYDCHDKLLEHKRELFRHLSNRWQDLFEAKFEVLLYDLTSTYFESDPPLDPESSKKRYGYSRDKRPDCVQVVIALVVTPEGFPLTYEVLAGNTQDKQTLRDFLKKIEDLYGKADRIWVMDRGIPTEEVLEEMRRDEPGHPPVHYIVGTPKGRLTKYEKRFLEKDWEEVRPGIEVKHLEETGEQYVLARSRNRVGKERSMRKRRLKKLWARLKELSTMDQTRDELLMRLGAARKEAGRAWHLVKVNVPQSEQPVNEETFSYTLRRDKLRIVMRREGRYLLRAFVPETMPAPEIWRQYIGLTEIEESFKNLKGDLAIRPVYHQKDDRIEAHIFVSFLSYCLHVALRAKLKPLATGLTPRAVLEKFGIMQMIDVHLPAGEDKELVMPRYTQPDKDLSLLLTRMGLELPQQPPPTLRELTALH
ncbi:MAG: IS1634 family transposase [Candidatus Eisenbacteria bacterium]|uniref:IS1634 family transposase n=1 Tax=Eiseniibacteriota bacterium TaxID=2212470 RepID=A0A7Y2E9P7_UNCEI|nr:IS1634 family transposase [Candidatus Eisenbacteria bacterium]